MHICGVLGPYFGFDSGSHVVRADDSYFFIEDSVLDCNGVVPRPILSGFLLVCDSDSPFRVGNGRPFFLTIFGRLEGRVSDDFVGVVVCWKAVLYLVLRADSDSGDRDRPVCLNVRGCFS